MIRVYLLQMETVVKDDHSLKLFNTGEHHYVSQIAPRIDLFSGLVP